MDSRFVVLLLLCVSVPAAAGVSNDLDVGWISRHPEIEYVWNNANPKVEGWPTVGDPVTWRAHVRNWSSEAKTARNGASMDEILLIAAMLYQKASSETRSITACPPVPFRPALR